MTKSEMMRRAKPNGNASTERAFVRALRAVGARGWVTQADVPGTPDIAFPGARVAVFLDGCFWHKCPKHYRSPKVRRSFWRAKAARNALRDTRVLETLIREGWKVFRVWEHELTDAVNVRDIARRVLRAVDTPESLQFGRAVDIVHTEYEPVKGHPSVFTRARHAYVHPAEGGTGMWGCEGLAVGKGGL